MNQHRHRTTRCDLPTKKGIHLYGKVHFGDLFLVVVNMKLGGIGMSGFPLLFFKGSRGF